MDIAGQFGDKRSGVGSPHANEKSSTTSSAVVAILTSSLLIVQR
jgi:hypothetical protein